MSTPAKRATAKLVAVDTESTALIHDSQDRQFAETFSNSGSNLVRSRRDRGDDLKDVVESKRKRYERLVEKLPGQYFFFGLNKAGEITYVSQSVKDVTGHNADAVIGKSWQDFVDLGRVENRNLEERLRRFFVGETLPHHQAILHDVAGKPRLVEVLDYPVIDSDGTVIEVEGIVHDITELRANEIEARRRLELSVAERTAELNHATQLYRSVVDLQTQFIVRWLPDGTRTFVNPAYCEYSRKSAEEMLGKPIQRMEDPSTRMVYLRDLQNLSPQNPRISREVSFVEADGRELSQHWIDQGVFDANGNLIEIQSLGRDISSERRRAAKDQQAQMFRAKMDTLSPREKQVMGLVTEGKANKVIASTLDLSVKTVEKHRSSMMRKLQMQSVAELVRNVLLVEGEI